MLLDSNELDSVFQNLLAEFEAVVNQAGSFVVYLFFSADPSFETTDEGISAVLNHIGRLKTNLQSSISAFAAYTTPRVSLVDSILILDSVVEDLDDLLKREGDPIADIKDQVNLLHLELQHFNSSIKDMESPHPSEIKQVKEALMYIGGIAHQAEYLITSFLVNDVPLWYVFNRVTHLRSELQQITQKYQFEGLKVVKYNFTTDAPLQNNRNTEANGITVGLEDKTIEILDQLVRGVIQSRHVISILGMPGLGKTTLANKLYNHPLVSDRFDKLAWCVVSQTYKKQSILANILIHISSEPNKDSILEMEEIILTEKIHKTLMGRRYLIILDDIWDSSVAVELLRYFPNDGNGSRILVTSRNKDVAPPNSTIHELSFLSDAQCWELLEKKVFGCRNCPPKLQEIGKKIAARCCGLPLTVVVIAGVLSTIEKEESRWEEVGGSLGSYIDGEDNSVLQILELSYNHLPDHLKPCFLYFGGFKEDEQISVGDLKRLWVAEGFIHKEAGKSEEKIAGEYLMELIDKSLVMTVKKRKGWRGAKSCVVHDLLRDLCFKISKEESFLKHLNNDYHTIYEKGHRLRAFGETATLSCCQRVRFFVRDGAAQSFYVRDMRLLRVLNFTYSRPIFGTEYLVNLRFLVIRYLPTWIDRLVNLEYLRLQEDIHMKVCLPPTIVKMKKLRYLRALSAEYSEDWNSSYQIISLEYLSKVIIRKVNDEEWLKCSPHLRKLRCKYDVKGTMDKSAYPHFNLSFLTQLDSLSLYGYLGKKDFGFPSSITKLTLCMSRLRWEKMSIVGRLEFLEVLKLDMNAFVGERWDTRDGEFQKLRFLQLRYIDLSVWNVASYEHFPELRQLILTHCKNLEEIPSEIGDITALELIEVSGRLVSSLVDSAERIKEEQQEMGNEVLRIIISDEAGRR